MLPVVAICNSLPIRSRSGSFGVTGRRRVRATARRPKRGSSERPSPPPSASSPSGSGVQRPAGVPEEDREHPSGADGGRQRPTHPHPALIALMHHRGEQSRDGEREADGGQQADEQNLPGGHGCIRVGSRTGSRMTALSRYSKDFIFFNLINSRALAVSIS